LRESEEKYRSLFEKMLNGFACCRIIVDEDNRPIDWIYLNVNDAFEKITGLKKETVIGKKVTEAIPGLKKDSPELFDIYGRVALTGEEARFEIYLDTLKIWFSVMAFCPQKGYFVAVFDDITENKRAEEEKKNLQEQLFHAQKMESIGRLAGGIAHDFNNILTGIMGYAELLKMQFPDTTSSVGQAADVILGGAERAANLSKQLLGFARSGKYNPVPLKINKIIRDTVKVSEKIFEKNIKVKYEFDENIKTIEADRHQLDQIFTNLIINAKDAMPNGGELILRTENLYFDKVFIKSKPDIVPVYYIKVTVADDGFGMSKEVCEHVFEPFFTTKEEGKGTGLGLATVYGIVKNHGGYIDVSSEPCKGTIFTLYFPVSEKKVIEIKKDITLIKGSATILVIDDEEIVINLAKKMLRNLGYKVLIADGGGNGLRYLKKKRT